MPNEPAISCSPEPLCQSCFSKSHKANISCCRLPSNPHIYMYKCTFFNQETFVLVYTSLNMPILLEIQSDFIEHPTFISLLLMAFLAWKCKAASFVLSCGNGPLYLRLWSRTFGITWNVTQTESINSNQNQHLHL